MTNDLTNTKTIDSRDIARMVEMEHKLLLRKVQDYNKILESAKMCSLEYFIPSTYTVNNNKRKYPCFLFTKMGCEFIANKFTGEKGVIFTAKYVKKFNDMEQFNLQPVQSVLLPEQKELNKDIKEAYKQAKFISKIMEEAGASAESKLNAVNKIYATAGIDLLEDKPIYKNITDLEFDALFQETVNKFSKMNYFECQDYIMNIKNDKSIDEKLKKNLLAFYICAYKVVVKNKLRI